MNQRATPPSRTVRALGLASLAILASIVVLVVIERPHRAHEDAHPQDRMQQAAAGAHSRPLQQPTVAVLQKPTAPATSPPAPAQLAVAPVPPPLEGEAAWRRNAVPSGPEDGRPMVAIVIDDAGLDRSRTAAAIDLPAPLTISFMTYAADLPRQTAEARRHGHELMLHIPMEPLSAHADPGPNALLGSLDDAEIERRLDWDLARIAGITGANNHMGSRFTADRRGMMVVEQALRRRGLFFLDSRTSARTVGASVAREIGLPVAERDVFLDDDMSAASVSAALVRTESVARRNGTVIAIGHPHDATIAALRVWLPGAAARGLRLVPVSAIVAHLEQRRLQAARRID